MLQESIDKLMLLNKRRKMIPLITGEIAFRQHVCELAFGVNVFGLDFGVQIDPVKQPIQRDSVGSGHVSHRRSSAFHSHLDYCFINFKKM